MEFRRQGVFTEDDIPEDAAREIEAVGIIPCNKPGVRKVTLLGRLFYFEEEVTQDDLAQKVREIGLPIAEMFSMPGAFPKDCKFFRIKEVLQ